MRDMPDTLQKDISDLFGVKVLPTMIGSEGPFCTKPGLFSRSKNPEAKKLLRISVFSTDLTDSFLVGDSLMGVMAVEFSGEDLDQVYFMFTKNLKYLVKLLEEIELWAAGVSAKVPINLNRSEMLRVVKHP